MEAKNFFELYSPFAQSVQTTHGIPASVVLGQSALESGWGESSLANLYNNFFGIKGEGDAGSVYLPTKEFIDGKEITTLAAFARYSSPEAGFTAYGNLIGNASRYQGYREADSPQAAIRAIAKGGYATDPSYADKVIKVMDSNYLYQYDTKTVQDTATKTGNAFLEFWKAYLPFTKTGEPEDYQKELEESDGDFSRPLFNFDSDGFMKKGVRGLLIITLFVILIVIILNIIPKPSNVAGAIVKEAVS